MTIPHSGSSFAIVGLGRMGANMARRIARAGLAVHGHDLVPAAREALADEARVTVAATLDALVAGMRAPRVAWLMLPAGAPTETTLGALLERLAPGDVIVDGGNADYRDSQRRATAVVARGCGWVDAGVSGGVWGLANGYGLMLGGAPEHVAPVLPYARALAPEGGLVHCGPAGAGHYAKMVHNGVEYGLMQAYAEGFALLAAKKDLALDPAAIADAWRHGTVVRSWLLDLAAEVLAKDPSFAGIAPRVADSGEGRWTVREGVDLGVPVPVIAAALMARFASQGNDDYAMRFLAQLRNAFGGHFVPKE